MKYCIIGIEEKFSLQEEVDAHFDTSCQVMRYSEQSIRFAAFDIQGCHPYVVIMDALRILVNILLFTASLFAAALFVEKIYAGRWKWVAFAILITFIIGFALVPGTLIGVLEALPGEMSLANTATLILGGVAAGFLATGV